MRKLVFDFELTVLWPLFVFALIVLWNSVLAYRSPISDPYSSEDRGQRQVEQRGKARDMIWFFVGASLLVGALLGIGHRWQAAAANLVWPTLQFVSVLAFIGATCAGWYYARRLDRLNLGICLLVMLLSAASTEHFFHQTANIHRATCPRCTIDDLPDDR